MKKSFIVSAVFIAMLFSSCAENETNNTDNTSVRSTTSISTESEMSANEADEIQVLSDTEFTDAEDFIKHFYEDCYKNIYLNSFEINLSDYVIKDSEIYNYLDKKIEILQSKRKESGNVTDFSVDVSEIDIVEENGICAGSAKITVNYRYMNDENMSHSTEISVFEIYKDDTLCKLSAVNVDIIDSIVLGIDGLLELDSSVYTEEVVRKLEEKSSWEEFYTY